MAYELTFIDYSGTKVKISKTTGTITVDGEIIKESKSTLASLTEFEWVDPIFHIVTAADESSEIASQTVEIDLLVATVDINGKPVDHNWEVNHEPYPFDEGSILLIREEEQSSQAA